ncbi:hypothetical protein FEZ18_03510 [Oceanihabitans sp. IOP_32]|uniref:outer membrane protein assembly factor BamB family protein n=1 Tax=Oceanihabitans sp. IOP_32 TaxID=2529032 RepID=UPI0012939650|nr:PQQ-binding-like beta-propeller repeat protein [Oceanihabitans sp. IOP_32]QFZ53942.1 hypothetical protein FEZ18_03510 [Oceanihabitans sp. IOP_32]
MKYIQSINEVNGCYFIQDAFVVLYKEVVRCFDLSQNLLWEKLIPGNSTNCIIYREHAYIEFINKESGFEKTITLDVNTGDVVDRDLENYMLRSVSNEGYAIALKYNPDYSTNTFCIQLPFRVKWEKQIEDLPLFIDGEYLVSGVKNRITSIGDNGKIDWKFDTSELGNWSDYDGKEKTTEILRILGVRNEALYSYLNNGKILVLDIKTGKKILVIENDKNTDQGSFSGMFMNAVELDEESGRLIQLFNQRYTEVDLNSVSVSQEFLNEMEEQGLKNMSRFVFNHDHIYFADKNNSKVGALDRVTKKIDWTYELSQDGVTEQSRYARGLKLNSNRLYVLDNKSSLHIFERQDLPLARASRSCQQQ